MKRSVVFAPVALVGLLALPAGAQDTLLGPLVELSLDDVVGGYVDSKGKVHGFLRTP